MQMLGGSKEKDTTPQYVKFLRKGSEHKSKGSKEEELVIKLTPEEKSARA